jgi:hypothetical protein
MAPAASFSPTPAGCACIDEPPARLHRANAGADGPEYVLEGSVFIAGALIQWLRDGLGIIESRRTSRRSLHPCRMREG